MLERHAEVSSEKMILGLGGVEGFRFCLSIVLARQLANLSNAARNQGNSRCQGVLLSLGAHREGMPMLAEETIDLAETHVPRGEDTPLIPHHVDRVSLTGIAH
jgi:hypothetical protein